MYRLTPEILRFHPIPAFMFFTVSLKRESLNLTMKVPFIYRDSMMINIDERCFTSYKYVYSLS